LAHIQVKDQKTGQKERIERQIKRLKNTGNKRLERADLQTKTSQEKERQIKEQKDACELLDTKA